MSDNINKIGEWVYDKEIGKGSFAIVYHGWKYGKNPRETSCAIKSVIRSKLTAKLLDNLEVEISILKRIHHPNVVGLLDCVKTPSHIHLVTSYCSGGDLSCYIKKRGKISSLEYYPSGIEGVGQLKYWDHPQAGGLDEKVVRSFSAQLAQALLFLRSQDLIHRDIKPQNLLLQPPNHHDISNGHPIGIPILRVADFGFARNLPAAAMAETLCGSPLYMAPEILRYEKYDAKADLWSVGTVMYEMCTGRPPYRAQNHVELLRKIEKSEDKIKFPIPSEQSPNEISKDIKEIIRMLLKRQPNERISFDDFFDWKGFINFKKDKPTVEDEENVENNTTTSISLSKSNISPKSSPSPLPSLSQQQQKSSLPVRPPLATHIVPNSNSVRRQSTFTPKYIVGTSSNRAATTNNISPSSNKSSPDELYNNAMIPRRKSLGKSLERLNGLQLSNDDNQSVRNRRFTIDNIDNLNSEAKMSKFALPANEDSVVGKEYVVVEKNAVEINNLADDMAAAARRGQPVVGRLSSKGTYIGGPGVFSGNQIGNIRRTSDPNVVTNNNNNNNNQSTTPPTPPLMNYPISGTSPRRPSYLSGGGGPSPSSLPVTSYYNQTYHQVAQDALFRDNNGNLQNRSALTRAINLASLTLFGSGTSKRVLSLVKGGKNKRINFNEQKEIEILSKLEELAQKSFVIFDFADYKLFKATMTTTDNNNNTSSSIYDQIPLCFQSYCQQRFQQDVSNNFDISKDEIEKLAGESILLYIRASKILSKGGELVLKYLNKSGHDDSSIFSDKLNDAVQWFRLNYNDCFDKADYAKLRIGNEIIDSNEYVNNILFERSMEIAKASALDELTGDDQFKCEAAYETSLWILEGLIDDCNDNNSNDNDNDDNDDRELFEQYKKSILSRLQSLKRKMMTNN